MLDLSTPINFDELNAGKLVFLSLAIPLYFLIRYHRQRVKPVEEPPKYPQQKSILNHINVNWRLSTVGILALVYIYAIFLGLFLYLPSDVLKQDEPPDMRHMVKEYPGYLFWQTGILIPIVLGIGVHVYGFRMKDLSLSPDALNSETVRIVVRLMLRYLVVFMALSMVFYLLYELTGSSLFSYESDPTEDIFAAPLLVVIIIVCILAPFSEELFFRGVIYPAFCFKLGRWQATILTSLIFSLFHLGQGVVAFSVRFILGIFLVEAYEQTKSLYGPIIFHAGYNTTYVLLFLISGGV